MKLKRLILSGFKSFADRTEFEFDDGVSCVVGPNGCGKSNVVDAVKWVLGEQSAKSLRGGEMMDVVFNGSSARKAGGMAEVTLVFDNTSQILQPNLPEPPSDDMISITRRLYRSGQSEYLINKLQVRLRDIREMFLDTGAGTDAYSLIEQGRVEGFLQASQDDRRAIFDEAAGISKYKARKKEALRKLERVEQNLLRLNDILAEVEKRLRSIKVQAGKARNYQAYAERLKDLKALHYLAQYHMQTRGRGELQVRLNAASDASARVQDRLAHLEEAREACEAEADDLQRAGRELQQQVASMSAQITTNRERIEMLTAKVRELGETIITTSARCEELEAKMVSLDDEVEARQGEMQDLTCRSAELSEQYESVRLDFEATDLEIGELRDRLEDEKNGTIDLLRRTAQLHSDVKSFSIRQENLHSQRDRLSGRAEQISQALTALLTERAVVEQRLGEIREVIADAEQRLHETRQSSKTLHENEQQLRSQLSAGREDRSGVLSRIHAIQEMQDRMEGVTAGVRKVLEERKKGNLAGIGGMLCDSIRTDVRHAKMVEAALSGADQQVLVERLEELLARGDDLRSVLGEGGALEALCLDRLDLLRLDLDLPGGSDAAGTPRLQGILGRVVDFVEYEPGVAPAVWRLLGTTLVAEGLTEAARAAELTPPGYRFVTLKGEVLEADGRVRFGAANRGAGVIARRSELADLESRRTALDAQIEELTRQCGTTRGELDHLAHTEQKLRTAIYEANTERVEAEGRLERADAEIAKLQREQPVVSSDLAALAEEIEQAVRGEHEAREKAAELEQRSAQRQEETTRLTELVAVARQRQSDLSGRLTELKVAMASAEERKAAARDALASLARQKEQMAQDVQRGREEVESMRQRRTEAEAGARKAQLELDDLTGRHQTLAGEAADVEESRQSVHARMDETRRQLAQERKAQEEAGEQLNRCKLELGELEVRIEGLISRANDEMNMNLLERIQGYEHDEQRDWPAVEAEVSDLRGKIERLGNVNLDAIVEQEELENRYDMYAGQIADVTDSRDQLNELIRRINKESREMFIQTFESVRLNFQELFRKLFGGGRADLILVNPDDVLESEIEIVARPPGKETKSLTLLSGGEKTMTALALLFSIFKTRPSPFCILDEVDAALDEANTQRFCRLVEEFVGTSQFIIISHAKRTMSMANVLYGVTMQEPGVSKRISVRFEDVGNTLDLEEATR